MPGAFSRTVGAKADVRALRNHDPNVLLGRTASGTLKLHEDSRGLYAEFTPPDTAMVRDMVLAPIERGDLSAWSFGFTLGEGGQRWRQENGMDVRELTSL